MINNTKLSDACAKADACTTTVGMVAKKADATEEVSEAKEMALKKYPEYTVKWAKWAARK